MKPTPLRTLALALLAAGTVSAQITTLTQSLNTTTIVPNNSAACTAGTGASTTTLDCSYFRSYSLAGIPAPINIVSIRFAVEAVVTSSPSGYPMLIRLYHDPNGGAPTTMASLQLRKTESFSLPISATNTIVVQPITGTAVTFSPNETIVVEIFSPAGPTGTRFFIGSNAGGQTAANYIRSVPCTIPEPVTTATISWPNMHAIIDVNHVPQGTGIPYPGTNEDFTMTTGVNANPLTTGVGNFVKNCSAGNTATVRLDSASAFDYRELVLMAQAFPTGSPPFPPAAAGIHLSFPGLTFMLGGPSGPFGPVLLPPAGTSVSFLVPPGLNGQSVIFQGAVVTLTPPLALNGLYASTHGHVFQIP